MSDTPNSPSDGGSIDQGDIDALFSGGSEKTETHETPTAETPSSSSEIDQGDIDALLNASGESPNERASLEESSDEADARVDTLGRPFDEAAAAMQAAIEEEANAQKATPPSPESIPPPPQGTKPFEYPQLDPSVPSDIDSARVTMLNDVNLGVRIELGRTKMLVEDVLRLNEGSVVELDRLAGDPVDVFANNRLVARGEVLVLNDSFCVRISEVFSRDPHRVVK